jgi:hypothetical protein
MLQEEDILHRFSTLTFSQCLRPQNADSHSVYSFTMSQGTLALAAFRQSFGTSTKNPEVLLLPRADGRIVRYVKGMGKQTISLHCDNGDDTTDQVSRIVAVPASNTSIAPVCRRSLLAVS